jgi:Tfp pilus assembly protein PilP
MIMRTFFIAALVAAWPAASARAQAAAPAAQTPAAARPSASDTAAKTPASDAAKTPASDTPAKPDASAAPADGYTYDPGNRRDPFLNLLGSGVDARAARRGEGPASMSVGEISVRGVLETHGSLIAMIQGPDNKTYVVHQGDKFLDGAIKSITPQGLIVLQDVNDPLSLVKQREVRKMLRSIESAKE